MITLTFDTETFYKQLNHLKEKWKFDPKFYRDIGLIILEDTKTRIKTTKVDPDGKPWAPWATSTAKGRIKKGNAALGLLFDSGNLYDSFFLKTTNDGFQISSLESYAGYLHNGTSKMPPRRIVGLSKGAIEGIKKIIETKFNPRGTL